MSYALQFGAVVFGLAMISMFNLSKPKHVKLLLAFSGAYLFSAVLIHFLPEIFEAKGADAGLFVLGGFLLQIVLDFFSTGIEHGHYHEHDFKKGVIPIAAIFGLFIHAFFEGLPIELQHSHHGHQTMLLAIVLHKIPITIVLYALLNSLGLSKKNMWIILILFAFMSPIGTLVGAVIPDLADVSYYLTAFAVGIFLHVSTTILFESSHNHRYNFAKLVVVLIGMAFAYVSLTWL